MSSSDLFWSGYFLSGAVWDWLQPWSFSKFSLNEEGWSGFEATTFSFRHFIFLGIRLLDHLLSPKHVAISIFPVWIKTDNWTLTFKFRLTWFQFEIFRSTWWQSGSWISRNGWTRCRANGKDFLARSTSRQIELSCSKSKLENRNTL